MTEAANMGGLFISAAMAIAVTLGAARTARGTWRISAAAVILLGGGISRILGSADAILSGREPWFTAIDYTKDPLRELYWWTANGFFWMLLFAALRDIRLDSWPRRVSAVAAARAASAIYTFPLVVLSLRIFTPHYILPWFPPVNALRAIIFSFSLAVTSIQVWLAYQWAQAPRRKATGLEVFQAAGLRGNVMSRLANQSTRLLCSSVLLGYGGARGKLLGWLKDENRAIALELGLNLRLAAQLARYAEERARKGWWIYTGIFCAAMVFSLASTAAWFLGALAAAIVWTRRHMQERDSFAPMFWPGRFDPEEVARRFEADLEGEDIAALPSADQNFFVYGGFSPFVGAGHDLGGWSVAIALDKARENFGSPVTIQTFEMPEAYEAIDRGVESLNLTNVEMHDCFFAYGTDVRGDGNLLPDIYGRPVQHLDAETAGRYKYSDDEKVRHYRCYRVIDWGGELALSYFIRTARRGNTMFVETKRFILTPLAGTYRRVDAIVPMETQEQINAIVLGVIAGPLMAAVSPIWAFFEINRIVGEAFSMGERHRHEIIDKNPLFNYGAATSLRQTLSSGEYGHYFQKMDGDRYSKVLEREVLDSLIEFLDSRGIDTSDLRERQTTILNTGVIVHGGDVKAESLAVGTGSRAIKKGREMVKAVAKGAGE